ncbi:OTU deubiquitinase, ubiquitin aldehyde binding 2 S homeolog [Xenopus laevis]|uniref:ubiquitinyl hydrolase 1 n=1 Tax=Xenopus laevis TaxID=8355 RepID=Q5U588_XENLA|nr:OTU deubiquitinase, ubiquitin aldehyde binding 2 S homeolog [Xenopus laevis]AAH84796.1 LOC495334 protein [Xenopus laevis]
MNEEFISEKYDLALLIEENSKVPVYQRKLKDLQNQYHSVRKTRADGSCFYRGLCFAYLEFLLGKKQEILRFKHLVVQSKSEVLMAGFQEHLFKHHYETFLSIVELAELDGSISSLLKAFNQPCSSDSVVLYVRLVTSAYLRNRTEFYQHFIREGMTVVDFCAKNVEQMATECDHIQIIALTQALEIPLQVEYVDKTENVINHHIFPEGRSPSVFMLFLEHHFNILYREEVQKEENAESSKH